MNKSLIERFNTYPLSQKIMLLGLIVILIFVLFFMFVYSPLQDEINVRKQQLTTLQREKEKLDQVKANRADVLARLEGLKRQLIIAREKLPATAEVPSLLQRIHNQGKTAGLDINKFKRLPDATKDYYIEIPVEMELVGTYDELANFFYYIGRMTRIVNVQGITLERISNKLEAEGELRVTARATTFMYKGDDAAAAAPGSPGAPK
jgi:type IV pilus assembly protein PilO